MADIRRLTALAVARAMLAGPPTAEGLRARTAACLDMPAQGQPVWCHELAARLARLPGEQWHAMQPGELADRIEADPAWVVAWTPPHRQQVRRYLLRPPTRQGRLPLGLDHCELPQWPQPGALCAWLGITPAGLWRLSLPADWQRQRPLSDQHYRLETRPKRSGGWRLLEVPAPYLAALQASLLHGLLDRLPPHEAAFGFTRGRSVVEHARLHAGQGLVLRLDLADFFASVRASRVHALFDTLGYPASVAQALTRLCTTATPEAALLDLRRSGRLDWAQAQRWRDAHLPQGAPTSPALANLCAFGLDLRLAGLAERLGARYSRYADDLVFSGPAALAPRARQIEAWVGAIALDEGFALNHRKTRAQRPGQRQTVCGIVVNAHPNLAREAFDQLKAELHRAATTAAVDPQRLAHLRGRVAWACQLNPAKGTRLARLLAQVEASSAR